MACPTTVCRICQLVPRRKQATRLKMGAIVCASWTMKEIADLVRTAEYSMLPK